MGCISGETKCEVYEKLKSNFKTEGKQAWIHYFNTLITVATILTATFLYLCVRYIKGDQLTQAIFQYVILANKKSVGLKFYSIEFFGALAAVGSVATVLIDVKNESDEDYNAETKETSYLKKVFRFWSRHQWKLLLLLTGVCSFATIFLRYFMHQKYIFFDV